MEIEQKNCPNCYEIMARSIKTVHALICGTKVKNQVTRYECKKCGWLIYEYPMSEVEKQ